MHSAPQRPSGPAHLSGGSPNALRPLAQGFLRCSRHNRDRLDLDREPHEEETNHNGVGRRGWFTKRVAQATGAQRLIWLGPDVGVGKTLA